MPNSVVSEAQLDLGMMGGRTGPPSTAIAWAEQGAGALRTRIEVRALQVPPEA